MKDKTTTYTIAQSGDLSIEKVGVDSDVTCRLGEREVIIRGSKFDISYKGSENPSIITIGGEQYLIGEGFKYPEEARDRLVNASSIIISYKGDSSVFSGAVTIEGEIGSTEETLTDISVCKVKIAAEIYTESLSLRPEALVTFDRCVQGLQVIKFEGSQNSIKILTPTLIKKLSVKGNIATLKLRSKDHEIDLSKGNYELSTSEDMEVHLDLIGTEEVTV